MSTANSQEINELKKRQRLEIHSLTKELHRAITERDGCRVKQAELEAQNEALIVQGRAQITTIEREAVAQIEAYETAMNRERNEVVSQLRSKLTDMEAASGQDKARLREVCEAAKTAVLCQICYDVLVQPALGPCGHVFCEECWRKTLRLPRRLQRCPTCRKPVDQVTKVFGLGEQFERIARFVDLSAVDN